MRGDHAGTPVVKTPRVQDATVNEEGRVAALGTFEWDRIPIIISFAESPEFAESHGFVGTQGLVWLEGQRLLPRDRPSDTVYIFMHPSSTLQLLPMPIALANAG